MTSSFVDRSRGLEGLPLFGALVEACEEASPEGVGGRGSPKAGAKVEATEEATKTKEATKKGFTESLKGASSGASSGPSKGGASLQEETARSSFADKTFRREPLPKEKASSKRPLRTRPYPERRPSSPSPSLCGEAFQDEGEDELFNGLWPEIWVSLKRWEAYMKERDPEWLKAFLSVDP